MQIQDEMVLDPSLALYLPLWKHDGKVFQTDDPKGYTCTATGTAWQLPGQYFDGTDDYIDVGATSSFQFVHNTGIFSILAWVKLTDYTTNAIQAIVMTSDGASNHKGLTFCYDGRVATPGRLLAYGSAGDATTWGNGTPNNSWKDNNWHLVAMTADSSKVITYYLDNVPYSGGTVGTVATGVSQYALEIGAQPPHNTWWFGGLIGEILIFTRCLLASEYQAYYTATKERRHA